MPPPDLKGLAKALLKESDRGCVIFGAAFLDDCLEQLLRTYFRSEDDSARRIVDGLFRSYAPLATFSSRIQLVFAMHILPRTQHHQLELIRRLRNDFAHQHGPIDFDDPKCTDRLRLLIGDPKKEDVEKRAKRLKIGHQFLTREEFVRRSAFTLWVCYIGGRIDGIKTIIEKGGDVRKAVLAMEHADNDSERKNSEKG